MFFELLAQGFTGSQVLMPSPLSNLIKIQADRHLSALHTLHIGGKLLMTTLLSTKERIERLDNVILLLIHSCFPHAARNSDNTSWPMCQKC